jgi:hypothetical protein
MRHTANQFTGIRQIRRQAPGRNEEGILMALFMDVHRFEGGIAAADAAVAHAADLATQGAYSVDYKYYWVDEQSGLLFCLVEAPDAETAIRVHREAHGHVADAIYPVSQH